MTKLERAVLKTLSYSDIFDFPLQASEIYRYLIEYGCTEQELSNWLYADASRATWRLQTKINHWQGYFYLGDKKQIVGQRIRREKIARDKLKQAAKLTTVLRLIPWIKMVAVTGRVAALNCEDEDDIDLLIITATNRLWLARLFEFLLLAFLRRRRRPGQNEKLKNKLCPNMYLAEDGLKLPRQDLFTANELARVKVVWERDQTYQTIIKANNWVSGFLPNWRNTVKVQNSKLKVQKPVQLLETKGLFTLVFTLGAKLIDFFEGLAKITQLKYMQRRRTKEVVENGLLMFHPRDVREKTLQAYHRKTEQLA